MSGIEDRVRICRFIEKMERNREFSEVLKLKDVSKNRDTQEEYECRWVHQRKLSGGINQKGECK